MERVLEYKKGLPVSIEALCVKDFPAHFHEDMQIIYVLKGNIDLRLCYITYNLKAGDMHFVHKNDIHSMHGATEDNMILLFNISVDAFSDLYPDFYMQLFTTRVTKDLVTYEKKLKLRDNMFSILNELITEKNGYQERVTGYSTEILRILYKDFRGFYIEEESKLFAHTVSTDDVQTDRISRVVNFVYENYPYKLSLNDIAESEHISKFYLSHLFQKHVGPNFRDFVSMVRVEMSEHQLLDSDMPITRISQECGFSHPKYFIEHFRDWFGYHPAEYREIFQKKTINYVKAQCEEIPLERVAKYNDVAPIFEKSVKEVDNLSFLIVADAKANRDERCIWNDLLEVITHTNIFDNVELKLFYLEFYQSIMEKGLKINVVNNENAVIDTEENDYFKHDPQKTVIKKIHKVIDTIKNKKRQKWQIDFVESGHGKNGLFTPQGLKTPMFYVFMMFYELYENVLTIGKNHLVTEKDKNIRMILFNIDENSVCNLDIPFKGLANKYRLTEMKLSSSLCFLKFLKQLDYKKELGAKDIKFINNMTFPRGRFEIIPDITQFVYHCEMDPLEVVYVEIQTDH